MWALYVTIMNFLFQNIALCQKSEFKKERRKEKFKISEKMILFTVTFFVTNPIPISM